jgi:hypothetical protein
MNIGVVDRRSDDLARLRKRAFPCAGSTLKGITHLSLDREALVNR